MELWLMSCRVLKHNMEYAMIDTLVEKAQNYEIKIICPTAKNAMLKDFYAKQVFSRENEDKKGNTVWRSDIPEQYQKKQSVIEIVREK